MATYFVGSSFDAFTVSPTGTYDSAGTVSTDGGSIDGYAIDPETGENAGFKRVWSHAVVSQQIYASAPGQQCLSWFNSAGQEVVRLAGIGDDVWALQHRVNGAWQQPGEGVYIRSSTLDVFIYVHPTEGRLSWYSNGVFCSDVGGLDTSQIVDIARIRLGRWQWYSGSTGWSQVIMATYNTIGHTVYRRSPSGPGAAAGWTGGYESIDDAANNDTDALSTSTVGSLSTFTAGNLPALDPGNVVKCVAFAARVRNDGGEIPTNAAAVLEIDGVQFQAPYDMQVSSGYRGTVTCFDRDPSTGLKWTAVKANCAFGVRATE